MPIEGKFYTSAELQELLGVSKQRISNLARQQNWARLVPGLYCAESLEWYLMGRGVDPEHLPVRDFHNPDGATWQEKEEEYRKAYMQD